MVFLGACGACRRVAADQKLSRETKFDMKLWRLFPALPANGVASERPRVTRFARRWTVPGKIQRRRIVLRQGDTRACLASVVDIVASQAKFPLRKQRNLLVFSGAA